MRVSLARLAAFAFVASAPLALGQGSFVNWETPHVHPLELTPDGTRLLAVNTADDRLEIFAVTSGGISHLASVEVGLDPVSVRARDNGEAWVANRLSDSVSIVDLATARVRATLKTADEPCDVVFAGAAQRAFVSCTQVNKVQVFDPSNLAAAPLEVAVFGEDPRAMATSLDGSKVYVAVFNSGNQSTVLGGGSTMGTGFPPNVVSNPAGPYGGTNPPPNNGAAFSPPIAGALPAPPKVGLIVKKNGAGQWMDDNAHNWTAFVSGGSAPSSGRPVGWDLPDHDVAVIDANTLAIGYADHLMNIDMAIAVNPASGQIAVVGTDGTNEIRFEPVLRGKFLRVKMARVDASTLGVLGNVDLNPHLTYATASVAQTERDKSIGDPRGIAWNPSGTKAYIAGMGSNNVIVVDASGARAGLAQTIPVGEGPTGVAYHPTFNRVFVLNKFEATISTIDAGSEVEIDRAALKYDPTPEAIHAGRKHLYDTRKNSGLGQIACGSCHVDARMDRLAWDLGNPQGTMKAVTGQNLGANVPGLNSGFQPFHPMKGPMTTQTLQDIVGKEPFHWRGDRNGLEEFNDAFMGLQGDDVKLTPAEMQEFEDFLGTVFVGPNPFRNFDNTLTTSLDTGMRSPGKFSAKGTPLPPGNAQHGHTLYRPPNLLDAGAIACASCHNLPIGIGTNSTLVSFAFQPIPPGPNGEKHHMLVSQDGSTNVSMKVPQLRNMYEKVGFDTTLTQNLSGFGFLHDGSVDTLATFLEEPVFNVASDQDLADLCALLLEFSGSELAYGGSLLEPPATQGKDTHAAVGRQTTMVDSATPAAGQIALIDSMIALANASKVGVVVKGVQGGLARGYVYTGANSFQSDRLAETRTVAQLKASAAPGSELTWTVVPFVSRTRIGVDRDEDGFLDRDELDAGADPGDPTNMPGCGQIVKYGSGCAGQLGKVPAIAISGCLKANGNVTFSLTKGRANSQALLVFGLAQGSLPIGGGCTLNVSPMLPSIVGPIPLDSTGSVSFATPIPGTASTGVVTMQGIVADASVPIGFTTTNGLELHVP